MSVVKLTMGETGSREGQTDMTGYSCNVLLVTCNEQLFHTRVIEVIPNKVIKTPQSVKLFELPNEDNIKSNF